MADIEFLAFLLFSAIEVGACLGVVLARKVVHAAYYLAVSLITMAGIFVLLRAEFIGIIEILVYAGAVPAIFLFGIMLTRRRIMEEGEEREKPA